MPKIVITHRDTGAALWEYEATDEQQANGIAMRVALETATSSRANLDGASLVGANLFRANLAGASLAGANLDGAILAGANLAGANLAGAILDGASLFRANLVRANLAGANLDGANLIGHRPMLQIGPIGSRGDVLLAFITDSGLRIRAGCFYGTRDEFAAAVQHEHGNSTHGKEYRAALALIDTHVAEWTPEAESAPDGKAA